MSVFYSYFHLSYNIKNCITQTGFKIISEKINTIPLNRSRNSDKIVNNKEIIFYLNCATYKS